MWTCNECGQENEGNFCIKCGKKFQEFVVPVEEEMGTADKNILPRNELPKKKSKAPLIIGLVGGGVLLLALIITLFVVLGHRDKAEDVPASTGVYYYVSGVDDYAFLYEESNVSSSELAHLENGDAVEYFYDENSKFVYVLDHANGLYGYMLSDELVASLDDVDYGEVVEDLDSLGDYYVTKAKTSLSLRTEPNSDADALVKLYNGDMVALLEKTSNKYWYVYDYTSGDSGYVLQAYLTDSYDDVQYGEDATPTSTTVIGTYYVTGTTNYLAIRSAASSDADVIIGKTYNGDEVGLIEKTNGTFWYVYDYSSGLYGYVKCAYLSTDSYDYDEDYNDGGDYYYGDYYVSGTTNYLAIRSEASSSADVEIGQTYNGNAVLVIEKTNSTFWYIYDYNSGLYGYVKCAYLTQ